MTPPEKQNIIFFVKHPQPNRVKTRLATQIGAVHASELYKRFITDILGTLHIPDSSVSVFITPPDKCGYFSSWLGNGYYYHEQRGKDLGEKMNNAFSVAFNSEAEKVVLVGSDIPGLGAGHIREAFEALDTCDAVIGPAFDGGYYLIGFGRKGFLPEVFDNIEWSTDKVFAQSIEILRDHGRKIHVMGELGDIDTVEDLERFVRGYEGNNKDSATISYIMEQKLLPLDDITMGGIANE